MGAEELRVHSRVQVLTEIDVAWGGRRVKAELRDISKGGARFVCGSFSGGVGSVIELFLASLTGAEIGIAAEVVRVSRGADGLAVAVRFSAVAAQMRAALLELIEVLLSTSDNKRASTAPRDARPLRRLEVQCPDATDLRAVLRDIANGGLSMACEEALVLQEPIEVAIPDLKGAPLLILRALVVEQQSAVEDDGVPYYDVFLEFRDMGAEARGCLDAIQQALDR
jgi:c-di-GMP-binding flagellar brake protein YcgR